MRKYTEKELKDFIENIFRDGAQQVTMIVDGKQHDFMIKAALEGAKQGFKFTELRKLPLTKDLILELVKSHGIENAAYFILDHMKLIGGKAAQEEQEVIWKVTVEEVTMTLCKLTFSDKTADSSIHFHDGYPRKATNSVLSVDWGWTPEDWQKNLTYIRAHHIVYSIVDKIPLFHRRSIGAERWAKMSGEDKNLISLRDMVGDDSWKMLDIWKEIKGHLGKIQPKLVPTERKDIIKTYQWEVGFGTAKLLFVRMKKVGKGFESCLAVRGNLNVEYDTGNLKHPEDVKLVINEVKDIVNCILSGQ